MVTALALLRTATKRATGRVPALQSLPTARGFAFRPRRNGNDDNDNATYGSRRRHAKDAEPEEETGDLYDPYREYMETTGERGYREFNPDNVDTEDFHREWEEPAAMMDDKSWPATTTSSDLFLDLLNIPSEPPSGEKLEAILTEAFARMGHTGHIDDIQLPEMDVEVPADHPDKEALEIMKLSMMNNGRLKMDDKNELLASIIDELNYLHNDKTTLFKGLEGMDEDAE
ncbi:unnamed protein product [Hyaloperonospora brassicae]|uniref:Uncharacterized protein n=1 Tax=Hyaloperonospora brassicae TaxID=162125 RepID=A0AAV0UQY6_HYABA|nr:unnamed protein product [Hyaloperonospora brassicae]